MKLIDADELIEKCGEWYTEEGSEEGFIGTLKQLLDEQLPVDAVPVRHGTWIDAGRSLVCSCCGKAYTFASTNYCWYCGAKMDVDCDNDVEDIENTPTDVIPIEWIEQYVKSKTALLGDSELWIKWMIEDWRTEQEKQNEG